MSRGQHRCLFALRLLVAGVVLVAVTPAAWGESRARAGHFTALTYNVAGLPDALSGSEPSTNSPLISPLLNDYDLVLLQEDWADTLEDARREGLVGDDVPRFGFHDQVVGQARHPYRSEPAPHPYGLDPSRAVSGPALNSDGLNRLSRYAFGPLDRVTWDDCNGGLALTVGEEALGQTGLDDVFDDLGLGVVNYEVDGGSADCAAHKGFSVARTTLAAGVTVDVYNLHADAGGHDRDMAARVGNFRQLAKYIEEYSDGHAVILGGDTNLKIDRPERESDRVVWSDFLAATGLVDVCQAIDCGADDAVIDKFAFRSVEGLTLTPRDHSFERDKFTRQSADEPLSDHDPLAVTFHWFAGRR